jgi:hypothetical protein
VPLRLLRVRPPPCDGVDGWVRFLGFVWLIHFHSLRSCLRGELMFSMSIHILDFLFFRRMDVLHLNLQRDGDVTFEECSSSYVHFSLALELGRERFHEMGAHLILSCELGSGTCASG